MASEHEASASATSTNGSSPNGSTPPAPTRPERSLESLRAAPENVHLLGGFGPLVVGVVLFVLMVLLAPTVAPEHVVEEPVSTTTTTEVAP